MEPLNLLKRKITQIQGLEKDEVERHLAFVIFIAKKFCKWNNCNYLMEDIVSAGNYGLVEACRMYSENVGKFSTYAVYYIKRYMRDVIEEQNHIRLPQNKIREKVKHTKVISYNNCQSFCNLELNENFESFLSNISAEFKEQYDVSRKVFISIIKETIAKRISFLLNESERKVIYEHYYLNMSISEIGRNQGQTKQNASLYHVSAIKKLRKDLEIQNLYPLYQEFM